MKFRAGVVGVFQNEKGEVLVCERSNKQGAWQFPQGGIDEGETAEQAVMREVREELGTDEFQIVRTSPEKTKYTFPSEVAIEMKIAKEYAGQIHQWFLLKFNSGCKACLEKSDGEFRAVKWVSLNDCLHGVVDWKLAAYLQGLLILGLIKK